MEFTQQNTNQNTVISYDDLTITLSHIKLNLPCYISSNESRELPTIKITEIDKELLFPLLSKDSIDLLIIGTGSSPVFLSPKQQMSLSEINLGVECMNNTSACSSFNLLLGDLRKVGLLIL